MPTVVVRVVDGAHDVTTVRLTDGGELLAEKSDGLPLELDPGEHVLRATLSDGRRGESTFLLPQGEKNRQILVIVDAQAKVAAPDAALSPIANAPPRGGIPTEFFVLGGVGLVGLGLFTGFAIAGKSKESKLASSCAPFCSSADVQPVKTDYLVADTSLGVGIVALLAAGYLAFAAASTRP